jgi:hypothetical protein
MALHLGVRKIDEEAHCSRQNYTALVLGRLVVELMEPSHTYGSLPSYTYIPTYHMQVVVELIIPSSSLKRHLDLSIVSLGPNTPHVPHVYSRHFVHVGR